MMQAPKFGIFVAPDGIPEPREIELGDLMVIGLAEDPADPRLQEIASRLGFQDYATAQHAPICMLGTPAEVTREIHRRIDATGLTYFMLVADCDETQRLFELEVMPEFVRH